MGFIHLLRTYLEELFRERLPVFRVSLLVKLLGANLCDCVMRITIQNEYL